MRASTSHAVLAMVLATVCSCQLLLDVAATDAAVDRPDANVAAIGDAVADTSTIFDGGTRWCEGRDAALELCEDFDGVIAPRWAKPAPIGGVIALDEGGASSRPRALRVATSVGAEGKAYWEIRIARAVEHVRFECDVRAETFGVYGEILRLHFGEFLFYVKTDVANLPWRLAAESARDGGSPQRVVDLATGERFANFARVAIDVDLVGHVARGFVDGFATEPVTLDEKDYFPAPVSIQVGSIFADAKAAWVYRIDNVTVDAR